ncbi:hypothetical protein ILUMI_23244 [Ignelater luminosus]|uniref:Uncharacterized protein n=1 Tax=Ignelater luminosus TaxID=2038154 RepID=A0A8K0C960_IGNLU|nr:hypothetical protein ILUMI_23244 [Ignelater luminosus]
MSQLIAEAYAKTATIENAISDFRARGVWPVDRYNFKDHQSAAFKVLNCKDAVEKIPDTSENKENIEASGLEAKVLENCKTDASQLQVSIEEILPVPKAMLKITKRIKKSLQPTVVLTSSAHKDVLEKSKRRKTEHKGERNGLPKSQSKTFKRLETTITDQQQALTSAIIEIEANQQDWHCEICEEFLVKDMICCYNKKCMK